MDTEKGMITAVLYNRSHTVVKFRIGVQKWVYLRSKSDLGELLGANAEFSGTWHSTVKGRYFLAEEMDIRRTPSPEKTMEKVLRLAAKKGVRYLPLQVECHDLLRKVLTLLYSMGRKQVTMELLAMRPKEQDEYLADPYLFYLRKKMDYYSAETLSQITILPLNVNRRLIALAHHAVTMSYEDGKECVSLQEVAETLSRQMELPVKEIMSSLDEMTAKGSKAGLQRVGDGLMLSWIYWLREKSISAMFDNPMTEVPEAARQNEYLSNLLCRRYSILAGGAGTGKTTLLKTLRHCGLKVFYAALTGKAATVLSADARTVHSMLGYRGGKFTVENLECDLVVVDESSMIGWHELHALLKASPRIVFSGDPAQLPPVQGDSVFRHMLAQLPHVELTKTWRFRGLDGPDVPHFRFPDIRSLLAAVKHMAVSLSSKGSMQVITPVNTGMLGVGHLNAMLRSILNTTVSAPMAGGFRMGDRVMVTRNVYVEGQILAANGQVGKVAGHENGMLWVEIQHCGPVLLDAKDLTYAYCQTVHKCQGDSFENVIFVVPDNLDDKFLSENLLLVGKTRGRNKTYVLSVDSSASAGAPPVRAAGNQ